ncbi:hypothetical protein [Lacrimispora sp. JR3]|uniref:hypothetical protein n=1 Tax=Lacrimispora sinapis TaxID=3111456 RepID=UPI003747C947
MKSIKDVSGITSECNNGICTAKEGIFAPNEIEKAEAIIKILDGMTIASARELLEKLAEYMLQSVFNSV